MTASALDDVLVLDLTAAVSGAVAREAARRPRGPGGDRRAGGRQSRSARHGLFDYLAGGKESVVPADDAELGAVAGRRRRGADRRLVAVAQRRRRRAVRRHRRSSTSRRSAAPARTPSGRAATSSRGRWAGTCTSPVRPTASRSGCPGRRPSCTPAPTPRSPRSSGCTSGGAAGAARRVEISRPGRHAHRPRLAGVVVGGVRAAARRASRNDLIRAKDGWVYVMRIVPKDELFVMIDRPDLIDENLTVDIPTWYANIAGSSTPWPSGRGQDGRRDRRARPVAARGRHAGAGRRRRARRRAARGARLVGARGRRRYPGQPYRITADPVVAAGTGPGDRCPRQAPSAPTTACAATGAVAPGARRSRACASSRSPRTGPARWPGGSSPTSAPTASRSSGRRGRPPGRWCGSGPTQDQQRQPWHRAMYFNEMNRNKRGVCIDLAKPDGQAAFLELVTTADIVIENNSARVMPNFGLGYDDLRAVNPSTDHGLDVGIRERRPEPGLGRLRRQHRDDELADVDHRLPRRAAVPHDAVLRRSGVRQLRRRRDHGGAAPPGPDR